MQTDGRPTASREYLRTCASRRQSATSARILRADVAIYAILSGVSR